MAAVLVINPHDDLRFVEKVEGRRDLAQTPETLEAELRREYPRAIVRPRGLRGLFGHVWYVYRDGRWTPPQSAVRSTFAHVR